MTRLKYCKINPLNEYVMNINILYVYLYIQYLYVCVYVNYVYDNYIVYFLQQQLCRFLPSTSLKG